MKKGLALAAAAMMTALCVNAQTRFDSGTFTLQPRLGGTGSMFINAPDRTINGEKADATAAGGTFTGLDLEYYLSERIGIAAGVNYAGSGTGWENFDYKGASGAKMEVKEIAWKTEYINIPLTLNWYVLKGFALKTGVQFGFLVYAKDFSLTEYSTGDTDFTLTEKTDIKDDLNKFDISIPIGLSYEFKFPIVIDFRFNIGLNKVNKKATFDGKDYKNMQAALTFGYKFKL